MPGDQDPGAILLPSLKDALEVSDHQHGFHLRRSTTSALLSLVTLVANGFNEAKPPRRTAAVAIDISKAFDCIDITILLDEISRTTLQSNIIRWLAAYLRGRSAACIYQSEVSEWKIIHYGVPQGSVISPILFNFFVQDFPTCAPTDGELRR